MFIDSVWEKFEIKVLGEFSVYNIVLVILVVKYLGLEIERIKWFVLEFNFIVYCL